jgi:uncharacterized protein (DUF58 family)
MLSAEAIRNIRKIQITTTCMADDLFAGLYRSAFRGQGLEPGELREYEAGDDTRLIDWNVTARTGRLHVKTFAEERSLTLLFLMDVSPSGRFGTVNQLKRSLAAEICALLSFAAVRSNDRIGMVLFTDRIEKFIAPRKGSRHALRIVREALYFDPAGKGTDIAAALDYAGRVLKRRTILFLVSDLHGGGFEKPLSVIARKHDTVVMTVRDRAEAALPDAGLLSLEDAETGARVLIDSGDARLREQYRERNLRADDERRRRIGSLQVDCVDFFTDVPYLQTLLAFFSQRDRRKRR